MQATRSPSAEMPHTVSALMDTAFVRRAVADAAGPAGAPHAVAPTAWARGLVRVRRVIARLASPA